MRRMAQGPEPDDRHIPERALRLDVGIAASRRRLGNVQSVDVGGNRLFWFAHSSQLMLRLPVTPKTRSSDTDAIAAVAVKADGAAPVLIRDVGTVR